MGCPKWDWNTIVKNTSQWGFAALELRGIQDQMDLPKCAEFSGTRLKGTLQDLSAAGLVISDLGASAQMHEPDPVKRAKYMDEARRFIDLAHQMHTPYVRVFPNQFVPGEDKQVTFARISDGLHELGEYAAARGRDGDRRIARRVPPRPRTSSRFWRAQNRRTSPFSGTRTTPASKGRSPPTRSRQLGKYTRHTHLKDSVPIPGKPKEDRHYVLTGTGDIPVKETVRVLASNRYKGYYCFEWEKRWHPDIDEPEVAFPHYAKTMRQYLAEAGVSA